MLLRGIDYLDLTPSWEKTGAAGKRCHWKGGIVLVAVEGSESQRSQPRWEFYSGYPPFLSLHRHHWAVHCLPKGHAGIVDPCGWSSKGGCW